MTTIGLQCSLNTQPNIEKGFDTSALNQLGSLLSSRPHRRALKNYSPAIIRAAISLCLTEEAILLPGMKVVFTDTWTSMLPVYQETKKPKLLDWQLQTDFITTLLTLSYESKTATDTRNVLQIQKNGKDLIASIQCLRFKDTNITEIRTLCRERILNLEESLAWENTDYELRTFLDL